MSALGQYLIFGAVALLVYAWLVMFRIIDWDDMEQPWRDRVIYSGVACWLIAIPLSTAGIVISIIWSAP